MRILFIANPISGSGAAKRLPQVIKELPEYDTIDYDIEFTICAGHGRQLVREAIKSQKYTHIVAVGGDGTVNEVGTELYGSDIVFAIVSLGSGNGFARHLGYSVCMKKALLQVLTKEYAQVDMLEINGVMSLNVSGVGYDAEVAHEFNRFRIRGVFSYIYAGVKLWFRYSSKEYKIVYDGQEVKETCFILSFANSSQYGNNASIAPHASLRDGRMDICLLRRPPFCKVIMFLLYFMNGNIDKLSYFRDIQCEEAIVEGDIQHVHIDGEAMFMKSPLHLKVHKGVLKVVTPKFAR